jgi:hypothetical protein
MVYRNFRLVITAIILVLLSSMAQADIIIHLKDGRNIGLPYGPDEVESISFTKTGESSQKESPPAPHLPAAPAAHLPSAPKPLVGATLRGGKRVLAVGKKHILKVPSDAARVAEDGDIIEIDAGLYEGDVAVWFKNNLTIRGIGGRPHIEALGNNAEGKATWVLKGANTTVENIEFSGSRVSDNNGSGIRLEGAGLTVDHCLFHDNQIGLLTGSNGQSDVIIRNSEFAHNALDSNQQQNPGHNVYIGAVRSFLLANSYVHNAVVGHNVKSRAARTTLMNNRIEDGATGSSSYLVDLPAGGVVLIKDNNFQKGKNAENMASISYGAERPLYTANELTVTGNNFINERFTGVFVDNRRDTVAQIHHNHFKGGGVILRGKGDTSNNP